MFSARIRKRRLSPNAAGLFLDGVYIDGPNGVRFRWVKAPTSAELTALAQTMAQRIGRYLERQGLLECDSESNYLAWDTVDEDSMHQLLGRSITYRIAVGPQAGRKVFTLQTLPACDDANDPFTDTVGKVAGFSLHAGVAAKAQERDKLERLCRYITRPAVSEKRLSLTAHGQVRYQLKTPYRDGTTHVTALAHPALAALVHPCTSSSNRWTSWPGWPPWCPSPESTSPGSMVYSHPTASIVCR